MTDPRAALAEWEIEFSTADIPKQDGVTFLAERGVLLVTEDVLAQAIRLTDQSIPYDTDLDAKEYAAALLAQCAALSAEATP